jgi:hypothetical protein
MRLQFMFFLLLAGCLSLASGSLAEAQQDQGQAPAAASPTGSAEISPGQVIVTYVDGRLTIKANKAPLSQILREVCAQTGVQLEFTPGSDEPIFADLGPGPVKKVIVSLLEGLPYDYVVRSGEDPNLVTSLIASPTPKTGDSHTAPPPTQARTSEPMDNNPTSKTTIAATANSRAKQLKDLLTTTKDEVAKARVSLQAENVGASPTDVNINDLLDQLDAQLSAVAETGDAASPSQTQQQPDAAAGFAVGRPRHRRR